MRGVSVNFGFGIFVDSVTGCVFKNPRKGARSAGLLMELSGLKGKRVGDAAISAKHANYIINLKNEKSADIMSLMNLAKTKVKQGYGVTLEPEVRIL